MTGNWVTRKRRSDALGTGAGGPDGGASGTQLAMTHHMPQWERAWLNARAREAERLRAFAASASASVSLPLPQMPGPAAAHRLESPPTGTGRVTRKRRYDAVGTGGGEPGDGVSGTQHASTHHTPTPQWESATFEARARDATRLRAFAASSSASVSAPPQMPLHAVAHRLDTPPMSTSSFTVSAQASVLEEFGAARAAYQMQPMQQGHEESATLEARARAREAQRLRAFAASSSASVSAPQQIPRPAAVHRLASTPMSMSSFTVRAAYQMQPVQQAPEEARKEDRPQQQRWGDHFIDAAHADAAAAGFASMLLDESLHEEQTEIEKKYWEDIMHLVNSPLETSVAAMPVALEASSSSAPLQTSVAVPAPEAYSTASEAAAASFSTTRRQSLCPRPMPSYSPTPRLDF